MCVILLSLYAKETVSTANPKVYSALGDGVFDSVSKVEKLKQIGKYSSFVHKIDRYIAEVGKVKKLGYLLESGQKLDEKMNYLNMLRKLAKENDHYYKSAESILKSAIESQDSGLFLSIVNSGMIDTKKNGAKIISYYKQHSDEIDSAGIIQTLIDKNKMKKNKKYTKKTKSLTNKAKVKRIREAAKYRKEALERKLADEVAKKKQKIKEEQERELIR